MVYYPQNCATVAAGSSVQISLSATGQGVVYASFASSDCSGQKVSTSPTSTFGVVGLGCMSNNAPPNAPPSGPGGSQKGIFSEGSYTAPSRDTATISYYAAPSCSALTSSGKEDYRGNRILKNRTYFSELCPRCCASVDDAWHP